MIMSNNKAYIFYEHHQYANTKKTIRKLMSVFKDMGVKSVCLEEPSDDTIIDTRKYLREAKKTFKSQNKVEGEFALYLKVFDQYLRLLKAMDQKKINFCSMDYTNKKRESLDSSDLKRIDKYDLRNLHMVDIIDKELTKGSVIVLVGASHFKLASLLKEKNHDVQEYYIPSYKLVEQYEDPGDICLRDPNNKVAYCDAYEGMLIDLYKFPGLNATQIVMNNILGYDNYEL